jgi:predicted short-subunit dehydrogenase-like oxidoreductase (DUF2520 family)
MPRRSERRSKGAPSVFVFGAGKAGAALARALAGAGVPVRLRAARKGLPQAIDADVVVLAVRDRDLGPVAEQMRVAGIVPRRAVAVHVAGALGADVLAPLRSACAGVAQMHPMISFASPRWSPGLLRGNVHIQGDPRAVARARALARRLGMTPRTIPGLDTIAYHAAAGLVANGAAALAAVGAELLVRGGVAPEVAPRMLGPLLRSVAENVERLGFPGALTGPVRRGDLGAVEKHLATLASKLPSAVPLYLAAAEAQLPLARAIGDAPRESFDAIADWLGHRSREPRERSVERPRGPRRGAVTERS